MTSRFNKIKLLIFCYKKEVFIFLSLTILNLALFGFKFINFSPFILREVFIFIFVYLRVCYPDLLPSIVEQNKSVQQLVVAKQPRLRFYNFIMVGILPSMLICTNFYLQGTILHTVSVFYLVFAFGVHFCYLYTIASIPEARQKYNLKYAIQRHGFRSLVTVRTVIMVCKECAVAGVGCFVCAVAGPKLMYGVQHRPEWVNSWASRYNGGIRCNNEFTYSLAMTLIDINPKYKDEIVGPDQEVISEKVIEIYSRMRVDEDFNAVEYNLRKKVSSVFSWIWSKKP